MVLTERRIAAFKFGGQNDNGGTWSWHSNIYNGQMNYTEFDLTTIGNDKITSMIRKDLDCHLFQAVSFDHGFSWTVVTVTNLGFGGPTPYVNSCTLR